MANPKISVVMAVYNGEQYLREAIDSILQQTFTDFEFIIINDASTDGSVDVIAAYSDTRIRLINNLQNLGLTKSLNIGLRAATGEYIARMDADDVSLSERFTKQVVFMDMHPDIAVCGTWISLIGRNEVWMAQTDNESLKVELLFESDIYHPTVMMRRQMLLDHDLFYNEGFRSAQDYELWSRLIKVLKVAVIPEVLLNYRVHAQSVSMSQATSPGQIRNAEKVQMQQLLDLGVSPSEAEFTAFVDASDGKTENGKQQFPQLDSLFARIITANAQTQFYDQPILVWMLRQRLVTMISGVSKSERLPLLMRARSLTLKQKLACIIDIIRS